MSDCKDEKAEAQSLWRSHVETAEPLSEQEVVIVVAAGLAKAEDWENRGGGLFWHAPTWPDPNAE